jgi:hypothetical protein
MDGRRNKVEGLAVSWDGQIIACSVIFLNAPQLIKDLEMWAKTKLAHQSEYPMALEKKIVSSKLSFEWSRQMQAGGKQVTDVVVGDAGARAVWDCGELI